MLFLDTDLKLFEMGQGQYLTTIGGLITVITCQWLDGNGRRRNYNMSW